MSRNSLGSSTFMFYPVIMMSTYTLDETKHYSTFSVFLSFSFIFLFLVIFSSSSFFFLRHNRNSVGNTKHFSRRENSSSFSSFSFSSSYCMSLRIYLLVFISSKNEREEHYQQQISMRIVEDLAYGRY